MKPSADVMFEALQNVSIKKPKIKKGISLRYIEEIFLENKNYMNIKEKFSKGKINKWF